MHLYLLAAGNKVPKVCGQRHCGWEALFTAYSVGLRKVDVILLKSELVEDGRSHFLEV